MSLMIIVTAFSFFIESITSNYISSNTNLFSPVFSLISLILVYPFFNNKDHKFLYFSAIFGLIYDIGFTNTLFLNTFAFLIVAFLIKFINIWLSNNPLNVIFITILTIVFYRVLIYFILVLIGYLTFNISILFKSIYSSLILNIIYVIIFYHICDYFSVKFKIQKID